VNQGKQLSRSNNILRDKTVDLFNDGVIFNEELPVLFLGATAVVCPARRYSMNMEGAEDRLLNMVGDCHIIFNGVESTEDEVE
jgi:hypothetical protein